jgi:hypothetical protein
MTLVPALRPRVLRRRIDAITGSSNLADMLARTGMRYKVVVISACYSGVFIPRLANPDTLVITAADADHPSFGCRDKPSGPILATPFSMSHSGRLKA